MTRSSSRFPDPARFAPAAGLLLPPLVCLVLVPFRTRLSDTHVVLVLVVAVVAVAVLGSRRAAALAALSAAAWFDFFFAPPYERFTISGPGDAATAVLLLAVGLAVSRLAVRTRRLAVIAITDADHLARIHETARLAGSAVSPHVVVDHVRDQLVSLLHLRGCRFEYGTLVGHPPRLEQDGTVVRGRRPWDADTLGLPDQEVELRVFHNGRFHGRFMMLPTPGTVPSRQARLVATTLAEQAGSAIAGTPTAPVS
ncbi:DUF4118 domain-containing protein [Actinacidiphila glaucinigra]|uniref:Sensor protein KdpD transmembrane domain-containing protein n=1 Tax=Actinacidiphila glaucinigra TaxID=235986 RepID=A0A239MBX4_9ACTN|nr:DUF4118 domain-containing protein [Actinacidiphila glaucinigra]SNT39309.1 protein of unknown function [Actinacidiphila glaucinigra]